MSTLRKISEDRTRFERLSRNSTGAKESEFSGPRTDISEVADKLSPEAQAAKEKMLTIVFVAMVFVGLGNKVFNKLMTVSITITLLYPYLFKYASSIQSIQPIQSLSITYRFPCIIILIF